MKIGKQAKKQDQIRNINRINILMYVITMAQTKNKLVQVSCRVKTNEIDEVINELEAITQIRKKEPINNDEIARYELEECQIILYTSGKIVYNLHYQFLGILAKYCRD